MPVRAENSVAQIQRLARRANIPVRHERNQIKDDSGAPEKWIKARDKIVQSAGSGYLMALIGPRGTGKTQIGVQAMLHRISKGQEALYVKTMELFLWIRRTYSDDSLSELDAIANFLSPRLLVCDEMGERGETPFEDRLLNLIIDLRYDAMLDTILIANLKPDELEKSVGPSITDRMRETGGFITCDWVSFRSKP